MRRADLEHNMKTFANRSLGIHGNELPKFRINQRAYWRKDGKEPQLAPRETDFDEKKIFFKAKQK